jgi:hypothetical protein
MHALQFKFASTALVFALATVTAPAADFGGAKWTYEKLFKDSDVVVIATLESTKETDELLKIEEFDVEVRLVVSKLKCDLILKGDVKDKAIDFRHWQHKRGVSHDGMPSFVRLAKASRRIILLERGIDILSC